MCVYAAYVYDKSRLTKHISSGFLCISLCKTKFLIGTVFVPPYRSN